MIQFDQLSKHYGPVKALDQASFSVNTGEIVGLLGPNGAGKTTAMKVLTCYMPPTAGGVTVDNLDVERDALEIRRKLGYLPEHNPLYLDMSVDEYLQFCARLHQVPRQDMAKRIDRTIDRCGLGSHRRRHIGQLSKGFRQRVGLAQAMVHEPEVLILDEPTTGLDPNQIVEIRNLIKELGREKTVLLSTHIMQEVQAVCSRVVIINKGRIVADDTAENLQANQSGRPVYTLEIKAGSGNLDGAARRLRERLPLGDIEDLTPHGASTLKLRLQGEADSASDIRELLFGFAVEQGWVLLELGRTQRSLEDVFRQFTTDGQEGTR